MKTVPAVVLALSAGAVEAAWPFPRAQELLAAAEHREPAAGKGGAESMAQLYSEALEQSQPQHPQVAALVASSSHLRSEPEAPPRKLLPIGEGAYQSAEAVEQRTKDPNRDCEEGDIHGCYHKDGADLVDGHSYGNLAEKNPLDLRRLRGSAATAGCATAVLVAALAALGATA
mmetsp:Transcript_13034/g.35710  ORF Transcript_13034/g.35710 Transcript_13034/m.35710 type:complete len:173 (+) Transcript_13034:90-608(+)